MKTPFLLTVLFVLNLYTLNAQSPADLNGDVNVTTNWSSVANIETSFNTARRQEETQLGLGANAIMNLDLPAQGVWDNYSIDQQALYIMNDERTSRAGINYGAGPVKGWPFNGIEANLDAVAQNWAQYNIDNDVFEHCHPTMADLDCPAGRIAGAYPNGCTEFGGGIENLHASSSGTIAPAVVLLDGIFGWIYEDAGSGWGHRRAMLDQSYDDDYAEAMQEGLVGFGIAQTTNAAVQWKTLVVINFANPVADAQAGACNYNITVTTNSLTGTPCATPPTINSVTAVQPPDCNTPVGSITVNATGNGTLQYSVDGGANWQAGNVINNLMPGTYNISVRLQAMQNCVTNYNQNPIVLNAPMGCNGNCTDYPLAGLNLAIPDNDPNGVESMINVPIGGTITDINIKNLVGTHEYLGDLTFTLTSPQMTSVVVIARICNGDASGFNIGLDDQAGGALSCPLSDMATEQPANPLSVLNGQNPMGIWKLTVVDDGGNDVGFLNGWTLEVCVIGAPAQGYTCATATEITAAGTYNAPGPDQGNGAIDGTHANWYKFTPPTSGMIRIYTCGMTNGGNTHFHVYDDASVCPTTTNDVQYTEDRGCAADPNDPNMGVDLSNIPVTAGVPIFIEWDDLGGNTTAFTWALEYMGGGNNCAEYVANEVPQNIPDDNPTGITSTVNIPTGGTITDINIKGLNGTHTYLGDLTFTLTSPQATSVVLIETLCIGDASGFNIGLDDQAGGALNCPLSDMATEQPANPLSVFNGQNPMGNWTLKIVDDTPGDVGSLDGWTLEVCVSGGGGPCPPNLAVNANPITSGTYQAGTQLTSAGSVGAGNNVTFRAANNVELQNNFTVSATSVLEVKIGGCQ